MAARVLIVEDSEVIRERIKALLAPLPSVTIVGHAETASDAISAILDLNPDVVTLDIGLRVGNGFDVLRWLSTNGAKPPHVIVVTLIEKDSIQDRLDGWNVGAILDKSKEFNQLVEEVVRLSHGRPDEPGAA
jgi:two-component system chemotaxis response regulator CheB